MLITYFPRNTTSQRYCTSVFKVEDTVMCSRLEQVVCSGVVSESEISWSHTRRSTTATSDDRIASQQQTAPSLSSTSRRRRYKVYDVLHWRLTRDISTSSDTKIREQRVHYKRRTRGLQLTVAFWVSRSRLSDRELINSRDDTVSATGASRLC